MIIPALFHWSPAERREEIFKQGLVPASINVIATTTLSYLCLSPTPSSAWGLSGGTILAEIEEWDLWQVNIGEHDEVHIRPEFGSVIKEVMVRNVILPDRIWYVGSRKT